MVRSHLHRKCRRHHRPSAGHRLQLSPEREIDVRLQFRKPDQDPRILIVTDKLLTGYDAPILYCMYLDKPMRDHVLLQAIARVNRPYVDGIGKQKKVGLVVDFVGVLRELRKALHVDSSDVSGVLEDLDLLLKDLLDRILRQSNPLAARCPPVQVSRREPHPGPPH
jgi:type I restriction enzyme R subunit